MITADSLLMASSSSGFFMSRGRATEMPCCKKGVTTMKMISSTSITSTIGVTLISEFNPPPPPACIPINQSPLATKSATDAGHGLIRGSTSPVRRTLWIQLLGAILDEIVNQLGSRVVHFDDEAVHLAGKVVKEPHGRNRDNQT